MGLLVRLLLLSLSLCAALAGGAGAQERRLLGWSGIATNDVWGDGQDRWRTGSYSLSVVTGPRWTGRPPPRVGELLEFRFHAEIAAPERLGAPAPGDRPYAGVLSFGTRTHFSRGPLDLSAGAEAVIVGPQTGLHTLHEQLHSWSGGATPPPPERQIANGFFPTVMANSGMTIELGHPTLRLRPFAEAQAGYETYARVGMDLTLGRAGVGELMVRERVSGFRHPAVANPAAGGLSLTLGADVAHLWDSRILPKGDGGALTDARWRLRVGATYDAGPAWVFFGTAWLGREFAAQPEGQRVGVISGNIRF